MGQNSRIEWTHHTFNPWWGCARVSPACKNCYADSWARRFGLDLWKPRGERRRFSNEHWRQPIAWNEHASKRGIRLRVFCASMADVFEARTDLDDLRERLWQTISATPSLDWLLLTKRPQNVDHLWPWGKRCPNNVWLGTTVENQRWAEKRIPVLLEYDGPVRFLSCEPLLGPIDLSAWTRKRGAHGLNWIIVGGESGAGARPMNPEWLKMIRDECSKAEIDFFFKQWGAHGVDGERRSKKANGRTFQGRTWNLIPIS